MKLIAIVLTVYSLTASAATLQALDLTKKITAKSLEMSTTKKELMDKSEIVFISYGIKAAKSQTCLTIDNKNFLDLVEQKQSIRMWNNTSELTVGEINFYQRDRLVCIAAQVSKKYNQDPSEKELKFELNELVKIADQLGKLSITFDALFTL